MDDYQDILKKKLKKLILAHQGLENDLSIIIQVPHSNQIRIQQIKKQKLTIKDEILKIRSKLLPDIIA